MGLKESTPPCPDSRKSTLCSPRSQLLPYRLSHNIGDLAKAIGMFSPEDVNLILRAIAQDNKAREMQMEIDELSYT